MEFCWLGTDPFWLPVGFPLLNLSFVASLGDMGAVRGTLAHLLGHSRRHPCGIVIPDTCV